MSRRPPARLGLEAAVARRVKKTLAPDSNALRVLLRLGYGEESGTYTHQYRSAAAAVAPERSS